jgi:RNA polymerase sigma-70 factor (ECF subfamily)
MKSTTTSPSTPAFADWYRANHPGLVEAVLRAVSPSALAADAVDEACARAFAGWDRVQAMRSPSGWVYRVAVNEARRQVRRATREQALLAAAPRPAQSPPPGGEAWLLVHDLPARQRATVVLRHVAGLTEAEIGAAMGVTRSTVSSSLAAAYRNLAARLAEERPKENPMPSPENWPLRLAVARTCDERGCEVDLLGRPDRPMFASYGAAVHETIYIRPGDLVALAEGGDGPEIVWRWWHGRVEEAVGASDTITVSRNVKRTTASDPRRASMPAAVPDELRGRIEVGETVWFGREEGRTTVVAVVGPEAERRVAQRFPEIRAAYEAR